MEHNFYIFLAVTCTLILGACTSKEKQTASTPVDIPASIFHNPDSLSYYAALAYKDEDPRGLFVTGAAAYLKWQDPASFPASCTTVSRDEADIMLLRAAELGSEDARQLILCLHKNGAWHHSLPTLNR